MVEVGRVLRHVGGPCEGCNEAGIECYVQIDPHGDERVSQVISRSVSAQS